MASSEYRNEPESVTAPLGEGDALQRMFRAAADGDVATVRDVLKDHPELVHAKGPHPFWGGEPQALQIAAEWGRLQVAELLLDAGADPLAAGSAYGGWTPLHCALNRGHGPADYEAIVRLLIARGVVPDVWAVAWLGDRARMEEILRQDPGQVHARGPSEGTPLHFAGTVEMAQFLIARGAAPQARNCYGQTPVQSAAGARSRDPGVAQYLMRVGGDRNIALACGAGDTAQVRAMLDEAPDLVHSRLERDQLQVGSGLSDGDTLLHVAASNGHLDVCQLLIARGADPNAASNKGQRPLHYAAGHGHVEVASLLLDHGADIAAVENEHGGTPLDWARFHGHHQMAAYLRRRANEVTAI
jgi:ankyrin repeat protein